METPDSTQPELLTPPQPNADACSLCNQTLQNYTPILETLCHHKFHTACFMVEIENDFHCPQCAMCLLGPNHIDVHRQNHRTTRDERKREERIQKIQAEFLQNPTLQTDFKVVKKEIRTLSGFEKKYKKFFRTVNRNYQTETEFFVKMIKQKKKEHTSQLRNSSDFKNYLKQRRRTVRLLNQFEEEYDVTWRDLTRVPDLKLKNYWYYNRMIHLRYGLRYLHRLRL